MSNGLFTEKLQGSDWIRWYYDFALKPFEVTPKIARFVWDVHRTQLNYWLETQNIQRAQKLIEETAYYISEETGDQYEKALDSWVSAEKYMGSLTALSAKLSNTVSANVTNQEILQQLLAAFSAKAYCRKVEDLARVMSRHATQQTQTMMPISCFRPAAEYHIITLIAGAVATTRTFQDALTSFTRLLELSAERYLEVIQEAAYYKWKEAGEPFGNPLRYWLESENELLTRLQRGERIGGLTGATRPNGGNTSTEPQLMAPDNKFIRIFISYSNADKQLAEMLRHEIKWSANNGLSVTFSDHEIMVGDNWDLTISDDILVCDAVVILVGPELISSDYSYGKELQTALDRSAAGEVAIIPIIVRDCKWTRSPLGYFQALASDNVGLVLDKQEDCGLALRSVGREVFKRAAITKVHSESSFV